MRATRISKALTIAVAGIISVAALSACSNDDGQKENSTGGSASASSEAPSVEPTFPVASPTPDPNAPSPGATGDPGTNRVTETETGAEEPVGEGIPQPLDDNTDLPLDGSIELTVGERVALPIAPPTNTAKSQIAGDKIRFSTTTVIQTLDEGETVNGLAGVAQFPDFEGWSAVIMEAKEPGTETVTIQYEGKNKTYTQRFEVTVVE